MIVKGFQNDLNTFTEKESNLKLINLLELFLKYIHDWNIKNDLKLKL